MGMFSPDENGWVREEEHQDNIAILQAIVRINGIEETRRSLKEAGTTVTQLEVFDYMFPMKRRHKARKRKR